MHGNLMFCSRAALISAGNWFSGNFQGDIALAEESLPNDGKNSQLQKQVEQHKQEVKLSRAKT